MVMYQNRRIEKWDNLKGILILCVVLGHLCSYYTDESQNMKALFFLIYSFHMPLFLFVSGIFSKKNIDNKRYDNIFSYLVLFYFIKIILCVSQAVIYKKYTFSLFSENGVPWYAFAMFVFSFITIAVRQFSSKYIFIISIVLGCFVGYDSTIKDFLVIPRIVVYYPFFFAGYCLDSQKIIDFLSRKSIKIISWVILLMLTVFIFGNIESIYWLRPLLTGRKPFSELGEYYSYGPILRFFYYIVVALICFAVISVTPNKIGNGKFAVLGSRSVQIYSLHYTGIYILYGVFHIKEWMMENFPSHSHLWIFPMTVLISGICALKLWKKMFDIVLKPRKKDEKING
jgi:fucose 4-O-acetylase-like acetyltransferase